MSKCKQWTGRINEYGYGTVGSKLAHRVAYEKAHGPIPEGMTVDHICHDPNVCQKGVQCPHRRCVNVRHMVLVSAKDNRERAYSAWSQKTHCPEGHPYSGDNLMVSGGKRYCRTCRNEALKERRRKESAGRCRERGHKRVEKTSLDGKVYCAICAVESRKH